MEYRDKPFRKPDSVYSVKVKAGRKRTYFFDVKKTRGEDYFIILTESTKRLNGEGYDRHKIYLFKEDFNRFLAGLEEAVQHVKTELLPDFNYDQHHEEHEEDTGQAFGKRRYSQEEGKEGSREDDDSENW